ncbi:MAG: RuvA C-terminal domain-containing protein [Candidatus Kapaibacteriota bacterium]
MYYEVISALNVLGFQENKVKRVVNEVLRNIPTNERSVENVLKNVLKSLNK